MSQWHIPLEVSKNYFKLIKATLKSDGVLKQYIVDFGKKRYIVIPDNKKYNQNHDMDIDRSGYESGYFLLLKIS